MAKKKRNKKKSTSKNNWKKSNKDIDRKIHRRSFLKIGLGAGVILLGSGIYFSSNNISNYVKSEEVIMESSGDPRSLYLILQQHKSWLPDQKNNPDPKTVQCQLEIFRYIQNLHNRGLELVTFEGHFTDDLHTPEKSSLISQSKRQYINTANDDRLVKLIANHENIASDYLSLFLENLYVGGWENSNKRNLEKKEDEAYQKLKEMEMKLKNLDSLNPELMKEFTEYIDDDEESWKTMKTQLIKDRSSHCYYNSLNLSDRLLKEGRIRSGDVAAIIGSGHESDFYDIVKTESKKPTHPKVVLVKLNHCEF